MQKNPNILDNDAVAGVIEALLIVALVSIVISMIQLIYIPQIMEQRESDHMDEVENQFSHLKSMIDIQLMTHENVPISSSITLGSRELPYFVTARSLGHLDIIDRYATDSEIKIFPEPVGLPTGIIPLTSIRFQSYNSYFVDQTYVLEGGGLFVIQPDGEAYKIEPAITVEESGDINVNYDIPVLVGVDGKNYTSGLKNRFIRTNYSSHISYSGDLSGANTYMRFYTDYVYAWNETLSILLESEINDGYVNLDIFPSANPPYVELSPRSRDIHLELTVVYIVAQIGPGYIITT